MTLNQNGLFYLIITVPYSAAADRAVEQDPGQTVLHVSVRSYEDFFSFLLVNLTLATNECIFQ